MPTISQFFGIVIQTFWREHALVLEWAAQHRAELMEDWNLCQSKQLPKNIPLLE